MNKVKDFVKSVLALLAICGYIYYVGKFVNETLAGVFSKINDRILYGKPKKEEEVDEE